MSKFIVVFCMTLGCIFAFQENFAAAAFINTVAILASINLKD